MQFDLSPPQNALHWEAILCIQDLWISSRFSEVIDHMFEGSKASFSLQENLYGGVFKVDGFHNADEGKETDSKKLRYKSSVSIWNRMVGLNNTCQYSARVETEDISSSRSWVGWTRWNKILFQVNCWTPRCLVRADYQRHIFDNVDQNYSLF